MGRDPSIKPSAPLSARDFIFRINDTIPSQSFADDGEAAGYALNRRLIKFAPPLHPNGN
jgi:hypothetical protein